MHKFPLKSMTCYFLTPFHVRDADVYSLVLPITPAAATGAPQRLLPKPQKTASGWYPALTRPAASPSSSVHKNKALVNSDWFLIGWENEKNYLRAFACAMLLLLPLQSFAVRGGDDYNAEQREDAMNQAYMDGHDSLPNDSSSHDSRWLVIVALCAVGYFIFIRTYAN